MPAFAPETFQAWFRRRRRDGTAARPRCCSGPTRSTTTSTRRRRSAAVEVLEAAGFQVVVPRRLALLRPAALRLRHARRRPSRCSAQILDALRPEIEAGTPIVGLEPSCVAVFRDELIEPVPEGRGRQAALGQDLHPQRVPGEEGARLPAAAAAPARRSCRATATTTHVMGFGEEDALLEEARPRLRGPRLRLLRHGRLVRLRGGALRRSRSPSASACSCPRCGRPTPTR